MRRTLRSSVQIGAPLVNMHMSKGVYFTLPDRKVFLFDRYREEYLQRMLRLRDMCAAELRDSDTCICIENTGGYHGFQREAVDILLESDCFGLTWDIGHRHRGSIDDGPFMLERRNRIRHFHVHDADACADHLALGDGEIFIEEMLSLAEACGARCVLETKTADALEKSVRWLRDRRWM